MPWCISFFCTLATTFSHSGQRKQHRKMSHHHPQNFDVSESGILCINSAVHPEGRFIVHLDFIIFTDDLHYLIRLSDSYHEVINMNQDALIIPFSTRQAVISCSSKIWCVNCLPRSYIYISSTEFEPKIYYELSDCVCPIQNRALLTIQLPDNK